MASLANKPPARDEVPDGLEESFPSLYLDGAQIDALGLTADDMGEEMVLRARVKLDSFSVGSRPGDAQSRSGSLTVMDGEIEREERKKSNEERAEVLFGGTLD
jgi:hypothetical protein